MGENERTKQMMVDFLCMDEFGQISNMRKTFDADAYDDGMTLPFLLEQFKNFLLGVGYSQENVNAIKFEEE